jgi:hypothetical protein
MGARETEGLEHLVVFADGRVLRQAEKVPHRVIDHLDQAVAT